LPSVNLGRALSNYTAQNLGAKREDRARQGFKAALVIGLSITFTISLLVVPNPVFFIRIFTNDTDVLLIGKSYLRIAGLVYFISVTMHTLNGILLGYEKTFIPMLSTIVSLGGVIIRYYYYRKYIK
jgi:Na+-driven multidrug efflux pump